VRKSKSRDVFVHLSAGSQTHLPSPAEPYPLRSAPRREFADWKAGAPTAEMTKRETYLRRSAYVKGVSMKHSLLTLCGLGMIVLAVPAFAQGPLPSATPPLLEPEEPHNVRGHTFSWRGITVTGNRVTVWNVVRNQRETEYGVGPQLARDGRTSPTTESRIDTSH
jgi:hypothetical protein